MALSFNFLQMVHFNIKTLQLQNNLSEQTLNRVANQLDSSPFSSFSLQCLDKKKSVWTIRSSKRHFIVRLLQRLQCLFWTPATRKGDNISRFILKLMKEHEDFFNRDCERSKRILSKCIKNSKAAQDKLFKFYEALVLQCKGKEEYEDKAFESTWREKQLNRRLTAVEEKEKKVNASYKNRIQESKQYAESIFSIDFWKYQKEHIKKIINLRDIEATHILQLQIKYANAVQEKKREHKAQKNAYENFLKELEKLADIELIAEESSVLTHSYFLRKCSFFKNLIADLSNKVVDSSKRTVINLSYLNGFNFDKHSLEMFCNLLYAKDKNELLVSCTFASLVKIYRFCQFIEEKTLVASIEKHFPVKLNLSENVMLIFNDPLIDKRWKLYEIAVEKIGKLSDLGLNHFINHITTEGCYLEADLLKKITFKHKNKTLATKLVRISYDNMKRGWSEAELHKKKREFWKELKFICDLEDIFFELSDILFIEEVKILLKNANPRQIFSCISHWISKKESKLQEGAWLELAKSIDIYHCHSTELFFLLQKKYLQGDEIDHRFQYLKEHSIDYILAPLVVKNNRVTVHLNQSCERKGETPPFKMEGLDWVITSQKNGGVIQVVLHPYGKEHSGQSYKVFKFLNERPYIGKTGGSNGVNINFNNNLNEILIESKFNIKGGSAIISYEIVKK